MNDLTKELTESAIKMRRDFIDASGIDTEGLSDLRYEDALICEAMTMHRIHGIDPEHVLAVLAAQEHDKYENQLIDYLQDNKQNTLG